MLKSNERRGSENLTVDEAAQRFRVSARTVWNWIAAGRLRSLKLGRRTTRIPADAIEEFLGRCAQESARADRD